MFRLLLLQVSQSARPVASSVVLSSVAYPSQGQRRRWLRPVRRGEESDGEDKRAQSVFEYVFVSFVFSRVPVRQANIYQSSPAQLFSASLVISTLRM